MKILTACALVALAASPAMAGAKAGAAKEQDAKNASMIHYMCERKIAATYDDGTSRPQDIAELLTHHCAGWQFEAWASYLNAKGWTEKKARRVAHEWMKEKTADRLRGAVESVLTNRRYAKEKGVSMETLRKFYGRTQKEAQAAYGWDKATKRGRWSN